MTKNQTDLKDLRAKAKEKEENISKKATGNLWLPDRSDLLVSLDNGEIHYKKGLTQEEINKNFVVSMIPKGLTEFDGDYGLQYHLEFIDIDTGEIRKVPLHAQLRTKLEELLDIEIKEEVQEFDFENQSENALTLRYCGKLASMKEGDKRKYHTWTGEKILD